MKLKKTAAALLSALIISLTPTCAFAEDSEKDFDTSDGYTDVTDDEGYLTDSEGNYKYSLNDDGTATIEKYLGKETSVVVPEELDGVKVTGFGDYTYYMREDITDITLSENIADFGWFSFYGCLALKEFKVNEKNPIYTVDENGILFDQAGECIMAYPAALDKEEYVIPDGIICINSSAFSCNPYLKKVTIPEGVIAQYMGIRAFAECTALETVVFPESLTAISQFCFAACTSLEQVEFTNKLQKIDQAAFYNCTALDTVVLPSSLQEIGQGAFISTAFDQIKIPAGVSSIGYSAFGYYTDDKDEIVQMDDFTIYGYNNTYAQSYCNENGIDFVPLDNDGAAETEEVKNSSDEKNLNRNRIIWAVCILLVIVIVIVIVILNNKSKKLKDEDEGDYEDFELEADETADEEEETNDSNEESDGEV